MRKLFGTDGIRGVAGDDLTPDLVSRVGAAVAEVVGHRIVIGRDTRRSGPALEEAFVSGFGGEVLLAGVIPTAGVAYLTAKHQLDAGVVVSASHNPPQDNGIKIFGPGGWKLDIATEEMIESAVEHVEPSDNLGSARALEHAHDDYVEHLTSAVASDVGGLQVVVDCANGAACSVSDVFERVGIDATFINCEGEGARINDGSGALHPEVITAAAEEHGAIGLTFDGDADRVLMADERGRLIDGDTIIALLAERMKAHSLVVTVMANQALREWCASRGISIVETPVGDRHVLEALKQNDLCLGGEQSGHIVCLDHSTTGDGILTALLVLDLVASHGGRLTDLVPFEPFPQVLVNVKTQRRGSSFATNGVSAAIEQAESKLGPHGRVLVRPSGTEPVVRVMVEAPEREQAVEIAEFVADAVRRELP